MMVLFEPATARAHCQNVAPCTQTQHLCWEKAALRAKALGKHFRWVQCHTACTRDFPLISLTRIRALGSLGAWLGAYFVLEAKKLLGALLES